MSWICFVIEQIVPAKLREVEKIHYSLIPDNTVQHRAINCDISLSVSAPF